MSEHPTLYTKETLIKRLKEIREEGWIATIRPGNTGGVGNTLEFLLGIKENNLPIPNAAEWELKCQRLQSKSLTTLFHMEPSPTALKFIPGILLPKYGWSHVEAGKKYHSEEMSFRQTIHALGRSERGFMVKINHNEKKILISFDASTVSDKHMDWLSNVERRIGLKEMEPQPYWGFDDLYHKAGTKLHNCFFVGAFHKKINNLENFQYSKIFMLKTFSKEKFIGAIENGNILIDFDARSGHNHGTKFRFRNNRLHELYEEVIEI